jgi:hypothetical protein
MGPYDGVDYNFNLCPFQSRLQLVYHGIGQPYARVDCIPQSVSLDPTSVLVLGVPTIRKFIVRLCREGFIFLPCNN